MLTSPKTRLIVTASQQMLDLYTSIERRFSPARRVRTRQIYGLALHPSARKAARQASDLPGFQVPVFEGTWGSGTWSGWIIAAVSSPFRGLGVRPGIRRWPLRMPSYGLQAAPRCSLRRSPAPSDRPQLAQVLKRLTAGDGLIVTGSAGKVYARRAQYP